MVTNGHLHDVLTAYSVHDSESMNNASQLLEESARVIAKDQELRRQIGVEEPSIWPALTGLWKAAVDFHTTSNDDRDSHAIARAVLLNLGKFTRNLVAGIPHNQAQFFENEPQIRRILWYYSSWSAMQDENSLPVTRVLVQTLSNMVTANEFLMDQLWSTYLKLPEDQVIIIRLIATPDARTILSVLVLVLNCIHGGRNRAIMLSTTSIGSRICISLLDRMVTLYDAEGKSDGAKAFDLGYEIFTRLFEEGLASDLYDKLTIEGEIITPHQTTLLKLLDSYLQSSELNARAIRGELIPMLPLTFFAQSSYAQIAIQRALGIENGSSTEEGAQAIPPQELDLRLPKVCEALVLVTQCIITIALQSEEDVAPPDSQEENLKSILNEMRSLEGYGLAESLIETLRSLDIFLPRIQFGRPVPVRNATHSEAVMDPTGFTYLKRDLVRLLGILCHGVKAVQDRVRACGGIPVIMNLCVVDERNPYLREHAIFTLRNVLQANEENQALVNQIKPSGNWDNDGVLQNIPGAVRK